MPINKKNSIDHFSKISNKYEKLWMFTKEYEKQMLSNILNRLRFSVDDKFVDNNEKKVLKNELPKDIEFQSIQGFKTLMACFYSESKKMSYWSKLPFKIGDTFSIEAKTSLIINIEVRKLVDYMFEENETIFKSGYDAETIGWQKALIQWKSDFNKESKDGLKWEDNPSILVCEFKDTEKQIEVA